MSVSGPHALFINSAYLSIHDTLTATFDLGMLRSGSGFGVTNDVFEGSMVYQSRCVQRQVERRCNVEVELCSARYGETC